MTKDERRAKLLTWLDSCGPEPEQFMVPPWDPRAIRAWVILDVRCNENVRDRMPECDLHDT